MHRCSSSRLDHFLWILLECQAHMLSCYQGLHSCGQAMRLSDPLLRQLLKQLLRQLLLQCICGGQLLTVQQLLLIVLAGCHMA